MENGEEHADNAKPTGLWGHSDGSVATELNHKYKLHKNHPGEVRPSPQRLLSQES